MNVRGHEHRPAIWWVWATARTIYCWVALAALTLVLGTVYLAVGWIAPDSRFVRRIEHLWAWTILRASFVDLEVEGLDRVEPRRSYIVMANHRSMYDIPVLHYILNFRRDLRWIGKQELLKVPVFGWVFGVSRHVSIDRHHREKGIAAMKRAADESAAGVSFVVMPEGTRSRDGRLLPFKKGGFHLAIDTRLPILPVAIVGSEKLMPKGTWWILPGRIELRVRPPIPTSDLDKSDVVPLRDRVRGVVRDALTDLPDETPADRRRK